MNYMLMLIMLERCFILTGLKTLTLSKKRMRFINSWRARNYMTRWQRLNL